MSQRRVRPSLYDAEERLIVGSGMGGDGLLGPAEGSLNGNDMIFRRRGGCGAFVEGHDDVGTERVLHFHAAARIEVDHAAIDMAFEGDTGVVDLVDFSEGEDLETAAVGEDGAGPSHETVEIAQRGDGFFTRAEQQVIGVGKDTLRAGGGEVIGGDAFHGALGADGHEGWGIEDSVARGDAASAGEAFLGEQFELERGWNQGRGRVAGRGLSRKRRYDMATQRLIW